ncbi:unnamed protein product [Candida verbasci]|uniref:Repressor of RNA polymerase III transcription MAF1 n=1 Tax=Candida verbasci TaxID=1227364 RepID=A0A9W4TTI8_9ASCO|nr:unnamed protein product [Candida verbasci]
MHTNIIKYIDEVDLELVNQELNFHSPDNNLVIRGGCELFTTKPIGSDRKLFKSIDKHLNQIIEDNQLSRSIEKERQNSISSLFGSSASSPLSAIDKELRLGTNSETIKFEKTGSNKNDEKQNSSLLSKSLNETKQLEDEEHAIDDTPFGPLKNVTTRKTFAYLIAILNSSFPDQDFTNLQPTNENFYRIETPEDLVQKFNNILIPLGKKEDILNWIWDIINSYMEVLPSKNSSPYLAAQNNISRSRKNSSNIGRSGSVSSFAGNMSPPGHSTYDNCQIYQFQPSDESIFEDLTYPYQPMWSYYWFIYNKKKKRVTFLHVTAINTTHFNNISNNRSVNEDGKKKDNKVITHDGEDDEEYDENDEYRDEEAILNDENDDVVGDLEI